MRVAMKLIVVIVLILATIRCVEGVLTVQRETARLSTDVQRDANLLDRLVRGFVREVWAVAGERRVMELLETVNEPEHPVRIVWVPTGGAGGLRQELDEPSLRRLAQGRSVRVGKPAQAGEERHHVYTPLGLPDADGAIRTTESLAERSRYLNRSLVREVLAGSVVVLFGGLAIMFWGVLAIGRPLRRLQQRIDEIGEGNLDHRVAVRGRDELASLGRGINTMCQKLSSSYRREHEATEQRIAAIEQMRHADRLTTIGRLASGIAHELGTPLNVVTGRANMIAEGGLEAGETRQYAQVIEAQGSRMAGIIRRLLDFARQRQPERAPTRVMDLIRQTVELVASLGYKGHVRVDDADVPEPLEAEMDAGQIQQVLINLIENALQAMPDGGEATVAVRRVDADPPAGADAKPGRFLRIDVRDTGVGIPRRLLPELFDPFFTTKDVGQGTGLGLSIAHGIVTEHGGWIDVSTEVGKGSCFGVYLPWGKMP